MHHGPTLPLSADATIGFNLTAYDIIESGRLVNVTVLLISGQLGRDVEVILSTADGVAICRCL